MAQTGNVLSPGFELGLWSAAAAAAIEAGWDAYAYGKVRPGLLACAAGGALGGSAIVEYALDSPNFGETTAAAGLVGTILGGMADEWRGYRAPATTGLSAAAGTLVGTLIHKL